MHLLGVRQRLELGLPLQSKVIDQDMDVGASKVISVMRADCMQCDSQDRLTGSTEAKVPAQP